MIMLLGGLRELIATTGEDGGDIGGITEVAVQATQALLAGPVRTARAASTPVTRKLLTGNVWSGHIAGRNRRPGGERWC